MPDEALREWRQQCATLRELLFDPRSRVDLQAGVGLLRWTDVEQLESTARKLSAQVRTSRRRGAVPLEEMYRRTLHDLDPSGFAELLDGFCASEWFTRHGEAPYRDDQLCIEEAIYRFLCAENIGPADVRHLEFVDAMIRALGVQRRPAFQIPGEIQSAPFGYVALAKLADEDHLFAIAGSRMICGPIGALTAEVVRRRAVRPADSPIAASVWHAAVDQLARLGLVFE